MYGNLADFKTYCAAVGYDVSGYPDHQLTQSLNLSSRKLDAKYRSRWIGQRASAGQMEDWPRMNAVGAVSGALYPSDSVPVAIDESSYELAFHIASGAVRSVASTKNEATIKRESKSLVSGMNKTVEYTSGLSPEDRENQIYDSIAELWLFDLLKSSFTGGFTTNRCL